MTLAWDQELGEPVVGTATEVFLQGDRLSTTELAGRFGRVEAGLVAEVRVQSARRFAIQVHREGSLIGEGVVLGETRLVSGSHLEALLPTRIRWYDDRIDADPALTSLALAVLAARTRHQHEASSRRRLQSQPQQVADWLVELQDCTAWGLTQSGLSHLTQRGLGTLVGAGRSVVSTILGRFERRGWLSKADDGRLTIDAAALACFADHSSPTRRQVTAQLRRSQDALAAYTGLLVLPSARTAGDDSW